MLHAGQTYQFRLYVNVSPALTGPAGSVAKAAARYLAPPPDDVPTTEDLVRMREYVGLSANLTDDAAMLDLPFPHSAPPRAAGTPPEFDLPGHEAFLVAWVRRELPDGSQQVVFARKVVPGREYPAADVVFTFPQQRIAVRNLNQAGAFGSRVTGGIAARWE